MKDCHLLRTKQNTS